MKPLVPLAAITVLCACATSADESQPIIGMANPASEFCIQQGGRLEMRQDQQGNVYALCHLPDGTVVEEWDYYRQHAHGEEPSPTVINPASTL